MGSKQKLQDMLDALINKNDEKAQVDFHGYLPDKLKQLFNNEEVKDEKKSD